MSKRIVLAAVVSLAFTSIAFAQSNTATVVQIGGVNLSGIAQSGPRNTATTVQTGFANASFTGQVGAHNTAAVGQEGKINAALIVQKSR